VSSGNATAMLNVVDPARNMVFEVHQYFDYNSSGSANYENDQINPFVARDFAQIGTNANPNNINIGVERLTAFTNWLKQHNVRGFLGEFALPNLRFGSGPDLTTGDSFNRSLISDETLKATLDYLHANDDVWEGWAWWGGGPWWDSGDYMFGLGPDNRNYVNPVGESPALPYLAPYMTPEFTASAGDFNQDDVVDEDDLLLWHMSYGRSGLDLAADGDDDGDVDGNDFLVWQQTLGMMTVTPEARGVPEPGSGMLMLAAAGSAARNRRRRRLPHVIPRAGAVH
jgi:hypothetical protein